ncbi:hypothetical protein P9112_009738 [Eukaryota sp. TZLM1-RC]
MPKIVVFDFWNTFPDHSALDFILRDYTDHHQTLATVTHRHINILSLYLSSLRKFTKFENLCLHALQLALFDLDLNFSMEQMEEVVERLHRAKLFDDVDDTLIELREKGFKIALYSPLTVKFTTEILEANNINQYIDYIESAEDHPALLPSVDPIKHLANRFKDELDDPSHLVFVSGSGFSCGAAKVAHIPAMKVVRVARHPKSVACFGFVPCPNVVVHNLRELAEKISSLM